MKTLHNPIIIGVISSVIISGVIFVMFQTIITGPSMQHQTTGNVEIQNIQVKPAIVRIGDTFTVSATLVNNLQNPISVTYHNYCGTSFFVVFDNHVTTDTMPTLCAIALRIATINPGEKLITVGPDSVYDFRATKSGIANATIIFSYTGKNQTDPNGSYMSKTISKSFLFTISQKENTTLPASFEPCDTPYPQSNAGIVVLYMPVKSIGKICVQYNNYNPPTLIKGSIFKNSQTSQVIQDVTVTADHDTIPTGNSTVVYTIKTTNQAGFYGFEIFCSDGTPLAVGYDNSSTIAKDDFPWFPQQLYCPNLSYHYHIVGLTGIGVKQIP